MDRKVKRALTVGGLAVGAYLLYRMSKSKSMPATQPGQRLGYLAFGDIKSDIIDASNEINVLYKKYEQLLGQIPSEMDVINPTKTAQFRQWLEDVRRDYMLTGYQDYQNAQFDMALKRYENGINQLANNYIPALKNYLADAPGAIAQYKADMASAKTAAEQAAALASAKKASLSTTHSEMAVAASEAKSANAFRESVDSNLLAPVQKGLEKIGSVFGMKPGSGFFDNMGNMINRFKWYAILAGLGYVAIKFGPSILRWVQSGQDKPAPAPVPPAGQEA